jgi:hypothetical protein
MRVDDRNASPRPASDAWTRTIVIATLLVVFAWCVYRPDRARPLHIIDFSEFIPHLESETGFVARTRALVEYYASQGRFNVVPYVLLAAKWEAFGWWSPGWQICRAALMLALFGLTIVLLRRLGASRLGAIIGGSVYLWAPSAGDGWVHLTMAEPLGAAIMLAMAIRAMRFQSVQRWQREVAIMAGATALLIWTKELMAPALLLPVCLALTVREDGSFAMPKRSRRNVSLVAAIALASVVAMVPIAVLYLTAGESAYASMYGRGIPSLSGLIAIWIAALLPFEAIIVPANFVWALAVAGFVVLLAAGWRAGLRDPEARKRALGLLSFALVLPLAGILAYLPNPWYAQFYTLPYLIGAALLLAMAVTYLQSVRAGALAAGASLAMLAHPVTSSSTMAARTDAVQRRDDRVIAFVADSVLADSVHFATKVVPPYDWLGFGAAMRRISAVQGRPWPPARYIDCRQARQTLASRPGLVTVDFESSCALKARDMKVISQSFRRVDWRRFQLVVDSAHADVILPTTGSAPP